MRGRLECTPVRGGDKNFRVSRNVSRGGLSAQSGFTLVEMLITFLILPIIIGAASFSLIAILRGQNTVSNRLTASADAQVVSASYYHDLQSASYITLLASVGNPPVCTGATGTLLVGLQVPSGPDLTATTLVSYGVVPSSSSAPSTTYALVRWQCTATQDATNVWSLGTPSVSTLAGSIPAIPTVTISGLSCNPNAQCVDLTNPSGGGAAQIGWASTYGVKSVTLSVVDTGLAGTSGGWSYSLGAGPRKWVECPAEIGV